MRLIKPLIHFVWSEKPSFAFYCRRVVLCVLLIGLGFILYERLPPVERWRVTFDHKNEVWYSSSPDGRFTFSGVNSKRQGPLRKRDAYTGEIIAEFSGSPEGYACHTDGPYYGSWQRYWAGMPESKSGVLDLFDLCKSATRRSCSGIRRPVSKKVGVR